MIGAYRVTGLLGQGGMGAVYVAEHTLLGRKAAIKVLLPAYSRDAGIVQRFFNEAKAVTQLSDPGIVQVFDFGTEQDGSAYIVMELLDGETVASRLQRLGAMSALEVVRLVRLVCAALHAAHAKGIIHRDLKPENLFIIADPGVSGGERAKVLDFGIAKLSRDEAAVNVTRAGTMMGTPQYMSPEQCRGAGEVDLRSDIYSLGCVMFTMLAGRPPFEGSATGELIVAHMQTPPPHITERVDVPVAIDEVLQRCLAKEPSERFGSMAELSDALFPVEDQLSFGRATPMPGSYDKFVRAPTPVPTPAPPSRPTTLSSASGMHTAASSQRRWRLVGVAGAIVVLGVAGIVLATRGDHASEAPAAGSGTTVEMTATAPPPAPPPPVDAALPDAPEIVAAPPVDAPTEPAHTKTIKTTKTTKTTKTHAHTNSATNVDRGD